eukprot:CAMPEP_0183406286 /NCGR_PEP_ID=MMETSP0370-20130417/16459_1 /TAXON_ID=268820 /ORGANISM="Peridinium aciculiferum, Strain PAER-2" /LENGTH=59 /DNA_ID=CAMNT_0025588417 /DNA_START=1 /DNA_END=177 /DNA_ORIENTATION=-
MRARVVCPHGPQNAHRKNGARLMPKTQACRRQLYTEKTFSVKHTNELNTQAVEHYKRQI